jgi:hypothetical protein
MTTRIRIQILVGVCLVAALIAFGVFWSMGQRLPAPAASVQGVLELRRSQATDPKSYERFFEATSVAAALAEDVDPAKGSRIPLWDTPRVVGQKDSSATVEVVWKKSSRFPEWPRTTTFRMKKVKGHWVIVDAVAAEETTGTSSPGMKGSTPATSAKS